MLKTANHEPHFVETTQTNFPSKLKRYFIFTEILSKNSENSCSLITKVFTLHNITLPTGKTGSSEFRVTPVKASLYRINDSITLIHSVVYTCHPEITQPIEVHYLDMKQINKWFEVIVVDLYKDANFNNTVGNVEPS